MALSKRTVALVGVLLGASLLVLASLTWATGSSHDVVLGGGISGSGGSLAPVVPAMGLVALAASIAVATTGRVARYVSAALLLVAGLGAAAGTVYLLVDPGRSLGHVAAEKVARTGSVAVQGTVAWPVYAALVVSLLLAATGIAALARARRWEGLSAAYEAPVSAETAAAEPERESLWDQVSREDLADPQVRRDSGADT